MTLPSILPVDTIIGENDIHTIFSVLRGSYPDSCLDVLERYLCILAAPPCDPKSNGLPMLFCEQDCVAYKILKEEGTCKSTIEFFREIAGTVGNKYLTRGIDILEKFDCNNVSTFYFFESDDYAETCTGLLSKQSKGIYFARDLTFVCILCGDSPPPLSLSVHAENTLNTAK